MLHDLDAVKDNLRAAISRNAHRNRKPPMVEAS